jgi:hypothetical protein
MESEELKSLYNKVKQTEKDERNQIQEELKQIHEEFLRNQKPVNLNYRGIFFTDEEKTFLNKWYGWMMGLVNEEIPPLNSRQRMFVEIYKTKISLLNEPPKEYEKWYVELIKNQKSFVRFYFVNKLEDRIQHYLNRDKSDSIYFFSKVVLNFGTEKYIDYRFKGTHYEKVVKRKGSQPQ